jgi:hypothetical protein
MGTVYCHNLFYGLIKDKSVSTIFANYKYLGPNKWPESWLLLITEDMSRLYNETLGDSPHVVADLREFSEKLWSTISKKNVQKNKSNVVTT